MTNHLRPRVVLTYGTFDLFHIGHLRLLQRLAKLGDELVVGVSTDEFNAMKGKKTIIKFDDRIEIVRNTRCVTRAIPECSWDQKIGDVKNNRISVFGMGADWEGKFDFLKEYCEVYYLPRTPDVSSTDLKATLRSLDQRHLADLRRAAELIETIVSAFE